MSEVRIQMTAQQKAAVRDLREAGFAVIIWHPEELGSADPTTVEARSIALGANMIATLREDAA